MAFSLVGTTITQTGTDTDLSGLSALAGVVTTSNVLGGSPITVYYLPSLSVHISGSLSQNPETELLVIDSPDASSFSLSVRPGGTYNLGSVITPVPPTILPASLNLPVPAGFATQTRVTRGRGYVNTRDNNGFSSNTQGYALRVESGATFNWIGATIEVSTNVLFINGSTVNITDGIIQLQDTQASQGNIFRCENATGLTVNGLTKINGGLYIRNGSPLQFDGFNPIHSNFNNNAGRHPYAILFYGNFGSGDTSGGANSFATVPSIVRDLAGSGNYNDVGFIDKAWGRLINPINGVNTTTSSWLADENSRANGRIETVKEFSFTAINAITGLNIPALNMISRDVNNSNRRNFYGIDDSADVVTSLVTNSSGVATASITTRIINGVGSVVLGGGNVGLHNDLRVDATTGNASFTVYDYLLNPQTLSVPTTGIGVSEIGIAMLPDSNVSETDTAVVAGYSQLLIFSNSIRVMPGLTATLDEMYDAVKNYKTIPANVETVPAIVANGSTLDAGTFTVLITGTLTGGTKFGAIAGSYQLTPLATLSNIELGGTFTVQDGATITDSELNGQLTSFSGTLLSLNNVTFGSNFSVPAGSGTGKTIDPIGTTTISAEVTTLFEAAGYTVNTPPTTITVPLAGKGVFIGANGTRGTVVELTAGQELSIRGQTGLTEPFSFFYKPTNDLVNNIVYPVVSRTNIIDNIERISLAASSYPGVLIGSLDDSNTRLTLSGGDGSTTAGGISTFVYSINATGSTSFNELQAKHLLLSITDTNSYLLSTAIHLTANPTGSEPIVPATNGTSVNGNLIQLSNPSSVISLANVTVTGNPVSPERAATISGTTVNIRLFVTAEPADGVSGAIIGAEVSRVFDATRVADGVGYLVSNGAESNPDVNSSRLSGIRPKAANYSKNSSYDDVL